MVWLRSPATLEAEQRHGGALKADSVTHVTQWPTNSVFISRSPFLRANSGPAGSSTVQLVYKAISLLTGARCLSPHPGAGSGRGPASAPAKPNGYRTWKETSG